ncbi:MAG: hypothetical protein EOO04_13600 [Chitinophagaceae bacterium]|nr:MAG: hypothetical protein EOO04_13600 [Chitinophagaceae bacterium]
MKTITGFCLILIFTVTACNKNSGKKGIGVEIYQLENYQMVAGKCQVEMNGFTFSENPIVSNEDIFSYDQRQHQFAVKPAAMERLRSLMDRDALAVFVDGEPLYYFINKPLYSSSTCVESITMSFSGSNHFIMGMGYPNYGTSSVQDLRNHISLLQSLRSQGKLL